MMITIRKNTTTQNNVNESVLAICGINTPTPTIKQMTGINVTNTLQSFVIFCVIPPIMFITGLFGYNNMSIQTNIIHNADCVKIMDEMPAGCIDLIVTSPPYNMRSKGEENKHKNKKQHMEQYDGYSDDLPKDVYVKWQRRCINSMLRVLKPTGAIFYNHKWRIRDLLLDDRHEIVSGFPLRQIIIWARAGGPNFNNSFFNQTYEVVYLIAGYKFKLKQQFVKYGDIWYIPQDLENPHPAPFPVELPLRCIRSNDAEIILDPFAGSGTTLLAAEMEGRKWIGIEQSEKYVTMATERIKEKMGSDIRGYS